MQLRLGRRSIGIELQPDYIKIGLRRLEIANHFNGEKLKPPDKTYIRKNGNGIRNSESKTKQLGFYDDEIPDNEARIY